jgi:ubiquinone/menaquinone biosynthesis C-methylase UbiE
MPESTVAQMFASADAYDRFVGRYGPALSKVMLRAARVRHGQRALDVGCGPGALTSELTALLGADHVAAVDPSPAFVEACRGRNPGVHVEVAAAEALPFDDDAFDVTIAQLVVNFMSDARAGVGEMRRVTRPGGVVGAAVWDYGGEMTLLRTFWDAARTVDPVGGQRDERNMRFATREELRDLWINSGLDDVEVSGAVVSAAYESFEDLWQPIEAGVGPAGAYTSALAPSVREELKRELSGRLGAGDKPFELTARAWVATGRG